MPLPKTELTRAKRRALNAIEAAVWAATYAQHVDSIAPHRAVILDGVIYGAAGAHAMRDAVAAADLAVLALRHIEAL